LPHFLFVPPPADRRIDVPIEAVAVWDTVGALGIPEFTVAAGRVDGFQFADTKLSPKVKRGLHAVAVDERRADFTPTLWDADPRITQVLFPGAHADVGGGYPEAESGLSDCALQWIAGELGKLGIVFAQTPRYTAKPATNGPAHQPWSVLPWSVLPTRARVFPAGLSLAQCLIARCAGGPVLAAPGATALAYAPANLAAYLAGGQATPGVLVV
jgi:type VI secretion system (T6SS) phospholipase Tle1-like effector